MSASLPYDRLKPKQRIALLALLRGATVKKAAAEANSCVRTVQRWLRQPVFQQAYAGAQDDFFENCRAEIAAATVQAFQALFDVARVSQPAERVRAASALLDYVERPGMSPKTSPKRPSLNAVNNLVPRQGDIQRHSATPSDIPGAAPAKQCLSSVQPLSSIA